MSIDIGFFGLFTEISTSLYAKNLQFYKLTLQNSAVYNSPHKGKGVFRVHTKGALFLYDFQMK